MSFIYVITSFCFGMSWRHALMINQQLLDDDVRILKNCSKVRHFFYEFLIHETKSDFPSFFLLSSKKIYSRTILITCFRQWLSREPLVTTTAYSTPSRPSN